MKKITILLGALILTAVCAPLMAQSFTDVPTDHWAYSAINELADKGYIVGYPDGTFGGKRALSRYEFAMAISRIVAQITSTDIPTNLATRDDIRALNERLNAVNRTNGTATPPVSTQNYATKADLDKVSRLVDEFKNELATLGVEVDAVKRELADLRTRMEAVEERLSRMPEVSMVASFIARGESTRTGHASPFDQDGRRLDGDNSVLQGVRTLYDADIIIKGKVGPGTATAVFNAGNYIPWLGATGGVSNVVPSASPADAAEEVSPYYLYGNLPMNWGPLGDANVTFGKLPFQMTPYTMKMVDVDSYTTNWKTDAGDYPILGASADFKVGPVGIMAYAGKHKGNVPDLKTQLTGSVDQSAGVRATVGVPMAGTLGLNYIVAGTNLAPAMERLVVMGADVKVTPFKNIGVDAAWTRSEYMNTDGDKPAGFDNSDAWDARVNVPLGRMNLQAGYRRIEPNFDAPGSWGKIGSVFNPTDIKGPVVNLSLPVTGKLGVNVGGEFYTGTDAGFFLGGDSLTEDDKVNRLLANVNYKVSKANTLDLGFERVRFEPGVGSIQNTDYFTVGVGHEFNPNASLKLLYLLAKDDGIFAPADARGSMALTQFTVKF